MNQTLNQLKNVLGQLNPTGHGGFEGLVKSLLEALTGNRYRLARAGTQEGRDLSTAGTNSTWIAVEAKHYPRAQPPPKRTFLGHLTETRNDMPDLDLWVLVASTEIPDQTANALTREGNEQRIAVQILDWNATNTPDLPVLCAAALEKTTGFLTEQGTSPQELDEVTRELETLAKAPGFDRAVERIKQAFREAHIGYDHAKQATHRRLTQSMTEPREAKANLHQLLDIRNPTGKLIRRRSASDFLNDWWNNWPAKPGPAVLLGDEGNGKTWAGIAWWLAQEDTPLTLFIPSGRNDTEDPQELMAAELAAHTRFQKTDYWERRLTGWLQRPPGATPQLLLIIDGLNERPDKNWRRLFHALEARQYRGRIAVIATCRNRYWEEEIDLNSLEDKAATFVIPPYDDEEFHEALSEFGLAASDLPAELNKLLRKPRFFRIARDYLRRGRPIEAVTLDRLFFDDWRSRYESKVGYFRLTPEGFSGLLRRLARDYREKNENATYDGRTIRDLMAGGGAPGTEFFADFRELLDGDLIKRDDTDATAFTINKNLLPHALGHLLADQAKKTTENPRELIAQYLEHYEGTDFAIGVRRSAAILAALIDDYPAEARTALWNEWLSSHNQQNHHHREFYGLAQEKPGLFLDFAEVSEDNWRYHTAGRQLTRAIHEVSARGRHDYLLADRFNKWLGTINTEGLYIQRQSDRSASERTRTKIGEHIEALKRPTSLVSRVTVISEEVTSHEWLSWFALKIISMDPKPIYAAAITAWALSRATMGVPHEDDTVSWLLRLNDGNDSLAEHVEQEAHDLVATGNVIGLRAAATVYRALGTSYALAARANLPKEITAPPQWLTEELKDPCHSFGRWRREHVATCLERSDIKTHRKIDQLKRLAIDPSFQPPRSFIKGLEKLSIYDNLDKIRSGRSRTKADLDHETIEPILAAYDIQGLVRLTQALINGLPDREEDGQFLLAVELPQFFPLIEEAEQQSIETTWTTLNKERARIAADGRHAEELLTKILLAMRTAEEQLELLKSRDQEANDLENWEAVFAPLGPDQQDGLLQQAAKHESHKQCRRILWFLSEHRNKLTPEGRAHLARLAQHNDPVVRAMAFKITANANDTKAGQAVVDTDWRSDNDDHRELESWYGSWCLATFGTALSFDELRARIQPELLGYAVNQRGSRSDEIKAYAKTINHTWNAARSIDRPHELPKFRLLYEHDEQPRGFQRPCVLSVDDPAAINLAARESYWEEPLNEKFERLVLVPDHESYEQAQQELYDLHKNAYEQQRKSGQHWLAATFRPDSLLEVVKQQPSLVGQWVVAATGDDSSRLLFHASQFYKQLCLALLNEQPAEGERLWQALAKNDLFSGSRNLNLDDRVAILFIADDNPTVDRLRSLALDRATTDQSLLGLLIAARRYGRGAWIADRITADLAAGHLWRTARALTMIGFTTPDTTTSQVLGGYNPDDSDWLSLVAGAANQWRQRDEWAKHWYQEFHARLGRAEALAAYRLFLRCVDRRFRTWTDDERQATRDLPTWKRTHLILNERALETAMEENEKELERTLYHTRIPGGQIRPWI